MGLRLRRDVLYWRKRRQKLLYKSWTGDRIKREGETEKKERMRNRKGNRYIEERKGEDREGEWMDRGEKGRGQGGKVDG